MTTHTTLNTKIEWSSIKREAFSEQVGEGTNHRVYRYSDNRVIKIPKRTGVFSYSNSEQLKKDLDLIKKYFPDLAVETVIVESDDRTQYCLLQEFFNDGEEISSDTIHLVRNQVARIVLQNKKLYAQTGHALDLFGSAGFKNSLLGLVIPGYKPKLSNLFIKKENNSYKVCLLDTELLRLKTIGQHWKSIPQWVQARISFFLTSILLRSAFNFSY